MNQRIDSIPVTLAALCLTAVAHAATTTQAGPWSDPATWGGTLPDDSAFGGAGDNNRIDHAVTIGATDDFNVRDLNLRQSTGGSITVAAGGNLNLNWDVNLGVQQWDTSSGYTFNMGTRQFRFWSDGGRWTHNADLNLTTSTIAGADIFVRAGDGHTNTVGGTGTLTVDRLIMFNSNNQIFKIDRNLNAYGLEFQGTNTQTVDLVSGITQFDAFITSLSANNLINFSGNDAMLRILADDGEGVTYTETDANNAISSNFIIDGTGNGLTVGTDGGYTTISVIPEPGVATLLGGTLMVLLVGRHRRRG